MTTLIPIKQTPSKSTFAYNAKKTFQHSGIVSTVVLASFIGSGTANAITIDPEKVTKSNNITVSEGTIESKPLALETNVNKNEVQLNVIKNTVKEYHESNPVFAVSLNGSLLEADKMKETHDFSNIDEVSEAGLISEPYSTFEIEEEEIIFDDEINFDFTTVTVSQESNFDNNLLVDEFDV